MTAERKFAILFTATIFVRSEGGRSGERQTQPGDSQQLKTR
jgi:hypothetical protein